MWENGGESAEVCEPKIKSSINNVGSEESVSHNLAEKRNECLYHSSYFTHRDAQHKIAIAHFQMKHLLAGPPGLRSVVVYHCGYLLIALL